MPEFLLLTSWSLWRFEILIISYFLNKCSFYSAIQALHISGKSSTDEWHPSTLFHTGILQVCALLFRRLSSGYVGIYLCFDNSFLQSDSWQKCYFVDLPLNQVITSRTAERMVIPSFSLHRQLGVFFT